MADEASDANEAAWPDRGNLLRRWREYAGLTQEELAERAGLSVRSVSNIERGLAHTPRLDTLRRLAEALQLIPEEWQQLVASARPTYQQSPQALSGRQDALMTMSAASPGRSIREPSSVEHGGVSLPPQALRLSVPIPLTGLLGREQETAAVADLLLRRGNRLVTITGAGGVGKTRLALHIASQVVSAFADGASFVSLADVRSADFLVAQIAQALHLQEGGSEPLDALVRVHLRAHELLLLLDNCEHLLPQLAPILADLLAASPRVVVLATSRVALRLRGEHVYPLAPLEFPREGESSLTQIAASPAVQLFIERVQAQNASATVTLDSENAGIISAICQRLDGLPLAIELAAARSAHFSLKTLLERLERRLPLLHNGAYDLPERQRTLRRTMAWSYDLLSSREQGVFRRLAVFAGGWTFEAAAAVCGIEEPEAFEDTFDGLEKQIRSEEPGSDGACRAVHTTDTPDADRPANEALCASHIRDALAALVDHHLIRKVPGDAAPSAGNPDRYVMLEMVREYAWERLQASGEESRALQRHVDYFAILVETADQHFNVPEQHSWSAQLMRDLSNLRAALRRALDTCDPLSALRLTTGLARFWLGRGYLSEGRAWIEAALALTGSMLAPTSVSGQTGMREVAADVAADVAAITERAERAEGICLPGARGEASPTEWLPYYARALGRKAVLAGMQSDFAVALASFEESLVLMRRLGDAVGAAQVLNNLGECYRMQGQYRRAEHCYQESLELKLAHGDTFGILSALNNLGLVQIELEDVEAAEGTLLDCLRRTRALGDPLRIARALANLGYAANVSHRFMDALQYLDESTGLWRELDDPIGLAYALGNRGDAHYGLGAYEQALTDLREALGLFQQAGVPLDMANGLEHIGRVLCAQERYLRAVQLVGAASVVREELGQGWSASEEAEYEADLSHARARLGEAEYARAWYEGRALAFEEAIALAISTKDTDKTGSAVRA